MRTLLRSLVGLVASLGLALSACGDDDGADPTAGRMTGEEESEPTTPPDPEGAIGEDVGDERDARNTEGYDSQTDVEDQAGSGVQVQQTTARVSGAFGEDELDLRLGAATTCGIDERTGARVEGEADDGSRFELRWDADDDDASSTLERDGATWSLHGEPGDLRVTSNGELVVQATYQSDAGEPVDAQLLVTCDPVS